MRSLLFVPGHVQRFFDKSLLTEAHAVIFDLEDAVPSDKRMLARENLAEAMSRDRGSKKLVVRINPSDTDDFAKDIEALKGGHIDFIMPTKVVDDSELMKIWELTGIPQIPLIETAKGLRRIDQISNHEFVVALALGAEDLMDDLQIRARGYQRMLNHVKLEMALACRASEKRCIDTPFLGLDDLEGYASSCRDSYGIGFDGRLCIHPSQIEFTNRYYYPSLEEQSFAIEINQKLAEAADSGYSVIRWKGELVGPPMIKRAKSILKAMKND